LAVSRCGLPSRPGGAEVIRPQSSLGALTQGAILIVTWPIDQSPSAGSAASAAGATASQKAKIKPERCMESSSSRDQ
jgi:hypothetical protein